jgi:hypothetical protein
MTRSRAVILLAIVFAALCAPAAAKKVHVAELARRAYHVAVRADKKAREPIRSDRIVDGGVRTEDLAHVPAAPRAGRGRSRD